MHSEESGLFHPMQGKLGLKITLKIIGFRSTNEESVVRRYNYLTICTLSIAMFCVWKNPNTDLLGTFATVQSPFVFSVQIYEFGNLRANLLLYLQNG